MCCFDETIYYRSPSPETADFSQRSVNFKQWQEMPVVKKTVSLASSVSDRFSRLNVVLLLNTLIDFNVKSKKALPCNFRIDIVILNIYIVIYMNIYLNEYIYRDPGYTTHTSYNQKSIVSSF